MWQYVKGGGNGLFSKPGGVRPGGESAMNGRRTGERGRERERERKG